MKFRQYGIEIYETIDAYWIFVICMYVGIFAVTAVRVARMHLKASEVVPIEI